MEPYVWGTLVDAVIADTPVRSGLMLSKQRHAQSSAAALLACQHEQFSGSAPVLHTSWAHAL